MRPVRALGWIALLVAAWLWWRAPIVALELDRLSAAAHFAAARADMAANDLLDAEREALIGLKEAPDDRPGAALLKRLARLLHPILARAADVDQPRSLTSMPFRRTQTAFPAPRRPAASTPRRAAVTAEEPLATVLPVADVGVTKTQAATLTTPNEALIADRAYSFLAAGERRKAANAFHAAIAQSPDDPRARTWKRQLALLEKRWSGSAYSLLRASGAFDLAARPVLGGGQSGAQIAYALDPLATHPISIEARLSAPNNDAGEGSQAALGVSWQVHPAVSLTVERLFAVGDATRSGWTARIAGGAATSRPAARRLWTDASIYGEAGAVGLRDTAYYGAVQGRLGRAAAISDALTVAAGIGGWASVQHDVTAVSRAELGPTVRIRLGGIEASADYRFRVAGNAAPGSGPVVTVSANF